MTKPIRIQRKRTKGFKFPPNTVSVTRPGRWGNQFKIGDGLPGMPSIKMDAVDVVMCFELFIPEFAVEAARKELRGKNLACFCALDKPCHANVLLELANA